jgi:hypothetical protein
VTGFAVDSAVTGAAILAGKMAQRRINQAELAVVEALDQRKKESGANDAENRPGNEAEDRSAEPVASDRELANDRLTVCWLEETAMTHAIKQVLHPYKPLINSPLPLVLTPPLHDVRQKLLFEFPYATKVIDFVLAD